MKSDDEDLGRLENLDHDPSKYMNLMQNMDGIECEYNQMGLRIWARRGMKELAPRYKIRQRVMRKGHC
jgi:hypothetical protein